MTDDADLIRLLSDAQRSGARTIDATTIGDLDRAAAYRILTGTQVELGEATGLLKTAVQPDGVGAAAPIYASRLGRSPHASFPVDRVVGLEVEVGVVLASDIPNDAAMDEAAVITALDHYFVGVEVLGTRYVDRTKGGPLAGFADNMSAYGYVVGPRYERGSDLDGQVVTLEFAGKQIYSAPAKHGFGTVLASLVAYARAQHPRLPLSAGTIITTGSLCGLVPTSGTGHVVAHLGDTAVELDIV